MWTKDTKFGGDEDDYRFNNRKQKDAEQFVGVLSNGTGRRLMYSELIGQDV